MPEIHPTAVVEDGAQLADDAIIGPWCYVGPKVRIGAGTRLISHVTILNRTTLGEHNTLWPQCTLGGDPQDLKFHGEDAELVIGDHNDIREMVTMHIGTENGGNVTQVGSHNLIMVGAHVAHDCILGSHIIIANQVQLAGHIHIGDAAVISGATAIHHFVSIGRFAFLGGMTRIVHDVPPFMKVEGNPSKVRGINSIGLERRGFTPQQMENLKGAYKVLYRHRNENGGQGFANMASNLPQVQEKYADDPMVQELVEFLKRKTEGGFGRYLETLRNDPRRGATPK